MRSLGGAFKVALRDKFDLQTGNYSFSFSVPRSDHSVVPWLSGEVSMTVKTE